VLVELVVRNLGIIDEVRVEFGPGMTAITGETGTGKTMVVEALTLLVGGRPDPVMVRDGASEATVEGWFVDPDTGDEHVLARTIPAAGRARCWLDGRQVPAGVLAETGAPFVELHGQHAHQTLIETAAQRRALDRFAGIDLHHLHQTRQAWRDATERLNRLGGHRSDRIRQADLLRFQVDEIGSAAVDDPDEDQRLAAEEERLADMAAHRDAAAFALATLHGSDTGSDGGVLGSLGAALGSLGDRPPFAALAERLGALQAEAADVASELRSVLDTWEEDPTRLAELRHRRQLLHDLCRKYGGNLAEVIDHRAAAEAELRRLEEAETAALALTGELAELAEAVTAAEAEVGARRRQAAPAMGVAVEERLRSLGMPKVEVVVRIGDVDPGDDVAILLGANPGSPPLPLAKVASGGELARTMLALRLVLSDAPGTMVFDEVDAGIGGEAALSVGRALSELGRDRQVVVVTHLAQVAAFADHQISVEKVEVDKRTVARIRKLDTEERLGEVARMLSGQRHSDTARRHAAELLELARGTDKPPGEQRAVR